MEIEEQEPEKKFLVLVIKELLGLCENKKGKNNKAVVASNIMYVVGQYPRFLKAHWRFLKTVVNKLFEFMHEKHPGVQDMSCDTFLKISKKCKEKFVVKQANEKRPFIEEIIRDTQEIISDLEPSQIQTFYEAVGLIISSCEDKQMREVLVKQFMSLPNKIWQDLISQAKVNSQILQQPSTSKSITTILKTNIRMAKSLGFSYICQLKEIYLEVLNVYTCYSSMISSLVEKQGVIVTKSSLVRNMRTVKRAVLNLLITFMGKCGVNEGERVVEEYVPPLLDAVLLDYSRNVPDARDAEVLLLGATIANSFKLHAFKVVPSMFLAVFECTLKMIQANFEDFPDQRKAFFSFLESINSNCFPSILTIAQKSPPHFKLFYQSIVWAFKHTEREIAEKGLSIMLDLWKNLSDESTPQVFRNAFHQTYFLELLKDLFFVLSDTFHKSSFRFQAKLLMVMFHSVERNLIQVPLSPTQQQHTPPLSNSLFLKQFLTNLLSNFKTLTKEEINHFILSTTNLNKSFEEFKNHLRDFLVRLKEFSTQDNSDLYLEEKEQQLEQEKVAQFQNMLQVPGLIDQYDSRLEEKMDS